MAFDDFLKIRTWSLDGKKTARITHLVQSKTWSGSYRDCARQLAFSAVPEALCELGGMARLYHGADILFSGHIVRRGRDSLGNTVACTALDNGLYLKRNSTYLAVRNQTPESVARQLCGEFEIPCGDVAATGVSLSRNFLGVSLYQIIQTLYTLAAEQTGKQYQIRFKSNHLYVVEKAIGAESLRLVPGGNLISCASTDSIENAVEICQCYHAMDALVSMFYIDETSGTYIDKQAATVGINRKSGTKASCTLSFTGKDGASVPAGTPFYTAAGLRFTLDEAVAIADGTGSGALTAEEVGAAYNIGAGEIVSTLKNYSGIASYANAAATGGTDPETDEALVARYYARMRRSPTSGNPYHYQQWAAEVDGVGFARVISKWDGAGTVKVLLASPEGGTVDADVAAAAAAHISAERPVGPRVTVLSATAKTLAVSAAVTIDGTTTKAAVQTALEEAARAYLRDLAKANFAANLDAELDAVAEKTYTVLYNRIAYLLLSIPGVTDYSALTVGGGTANITVAADEVPVLGEVAVS